MNRLLVVVSGAVTLTAGAVYVRSAVREARPQMVSWLAWTALLLVGATSSLSMGQLPSGVYVLACAAMCAAVVVIVFRRGTWKTGPLGWACLAGAAAGLLLLTVVRSPSAATAITVAVDFIAYIPTGVHAWQEPREEPWTAFAGFAAGAALALAAAGWTSFPAMGWGSMPAIAYPLYLAAADTVVAAMILGRRAALRQADMPARPAAGPLPPALVSEWVQPEGPPLWPGEAAGEPLDRPVSVPLPPCPDDGLRWYERPDWYATVRLSGLLPELTEIAGRAWVLDTIRWAQEQAASMCLGHHRHGCRECAPAALRCLRPGGP